MRRYLISIVVSELLVTGILIRIALVRSNDFTNYHQSLAQQSTLGLSASVTEFVSEKKRLVNVFASRYADIIHQVAAQPQVEGLHHSLEAVISEFFPSFFVYNIADKYGNFLIDDFDGAVSELCQQDFLKFLETGLQQPRIHPNNLAYHFDIITSPPDSTLSLFVSFKADILGTLLQNAQTPGHQLMLVHPDANMLIEVTATGARNNLHRDDFHLTENEKSRILSSTPVAATSWAVVDLRDPYLFASFQ